MSQVTKPKSITAVLQEAGYTRAGRYTPFDGYIDADGNPKPGFIVKHYYRFMGPRQPRGPLYKTVVLVCGYRHRVAAVVEKQKIAAALTGAGYTATASNSDHYHAVEITYPEAA